MLGNHKLIVDCWAEVYDLLKSYADEEFWQFADIEFDPNAIYVIGRVQLKENYLRICDLAERYPGRIVFCNPAEGSQTIILQLKRLRITHLVQEQKIKLLTSGDLESGFHQMSVDCYFTKIVDYTENVEAAEHSDQIYQQINKPYDFLFLNGRLRPHRKFLIDLLRKKSVLDRALWTCLQDHVDMPWSSSLENFQNQEPLRFLPSAYEISRAVPKLNEEKPAKDVKHFLFSNTWGDAIVNPKAYIDSYFSLVTETVYDYPYSFRTEKIWKPILMAHPWIAVANRGYYRDLQAKGFQTFGHLLDESFDQIDSSLDRINRIADIVEDVIEQGACDFLQQSQEVCKYNQQRLKEYNQEQRHSLPNDFLNFINQ